MHVIIQAGGKGTRLEGLTRNRPKCLVPVNNRPMIFRAFRAFADCDIKVICDYKADVLRRYLSAFAKDWQIEVVDAGGIGTASGIARALERVEDDEPVVVTWCDLLFDDDFELPECLRGGRLEENWIGLSGTFPCRWSFREGGFVHEASESAGVAGFFAFRNKAELADVPADGALVPWLQEMGIVFKPFYLEKVTEVGTVAAFEKLMKPAVCRPFNDVQFSAETVTKSGINEQGRRIAIDEVAWYRHVSELGFTQIPKIYSYSPLVMERISGRNIWEYDCLTLTEKRRVVDSIVDGLDRLHHLEAPVPAVESDLDETYITKTFERLEKVRDLVPFARDEYIRINDRWYRNIFYDQDVLSAVFKRRYPKEFRLIHGDCTFSNMIYDRLHGEVRFIDPRGYFGKTKLYGDVDYDWAKVYYSLVGNYDQFNRKKFALDIQEKSVELAVRPSNWADMENYFFEKLEGVSRTKIQALHAVIWLSLTTYAWEDYDSICGAFYNGIIKSADFL